MKVHNRGALFMGWLITHVKPSYFFTPIGTSNRVSRYEIEGNGRNHTYQTKGHTNIYIFGIRVASFQRTKPWE